MSGREGFKLERSCEWEFNKTLSLTQQPVLAVCEWVSESSESSEAQGGACNRYFLCKRSYFFFTLGRGCSGRGGAGLWGGVGMSGWGVGGRRRGSGVTAPVVRATASEEAVARVSPVA